MSQTIIGLDLGQASDYTAICVIEADDAKTYQLRHLDRWRGVPYPAIVEKVRNVVDALPGGSRLAVDATGVGAAVVDLIRAANLRTDLIPISIHGGEKATHDREGWRVPKRDLVGVVSVVLETDRLKIVARLPHAKTLGDELLNFRVKTDPATAHDSYASWREKDHDDLVLAVALALYVPESGPHSCNPMCPKCRESRAMLARWYAEQPRSPFADPPGHRGHSWGDPLPPSRSNF